MKKGLFIKLASLILVFALASFSLYAWFASGLTEIKNIVFETGNLDLMPYFYQIQDINRDGYYDYDKEGRVILVDTNNMLPIIKVEDAIEWDVFSFRFIAVNAGDVRVAFVVELDNLNSKINDVITWNVNDYYIYKPLSGADVATVTTFEDLDDPTIFSKDVISRPGKSVYSSLEVLVVEDEYLVSPQEILVIDFQIKFEKLEKLQVLNPTIFDDLSSLDDYRSVNFAKTIIYVSYLSY